MHMQSFRYIQSRGRMYNKYVNVKYLANVVYKYIEGRGEPLYKLLLHGTENEGKLDAMKRLLQNNKLRKESGVD